MSSVLASVGRVAAAPNGPKPISPESGSPAGSDFAEKLLKVISDASAAEEHADKVAVEFASGNPDVGIHETIIAAEQASIQIRYAVTLKNKLLDAYRELMNTQI